MMKSKNRNPNDRPVIIASAICLTLALGGCAKSTDQTESDASAPPAESQPAEAPSVAANLSEPVEQGLPEESSEPSDPDADWSEVVNASRPPVPPEEWAEEPPTPEESEAWRKDNLDKARRAAELAKTFYTKYPGNRNANAARQIELQMLRELERLGDSDAAVQVAQADRQRANDPSLPEDQRLQLRIQMLQKELMAKQGDMEGMARAMHDTALELRKDFPEREEVNMVLDQALSLNYQAGIQENISELTGILESISDEKIKLAPEKMESYRYNIEIASNATLAGDFATANRIISKLEAENLPDQIVQMCSGIKDAIGKEQEKRDRVGKPLELKFTAIDGREVDLSAMQGKVVLIDFWATWCGPCIVALPGVKAAYEKYHPRGFEIVGISFDEDEGALKKFVKNQKIPWPQYFDGKGWENEFGQEFGIRSIPTMWLVDKNGLLHDLNGRENFEAKVAALLEESLEADSKTSSP